MALQSKPNSHGGCNYRWVDDWSFSGLFCSSSSPVVIIDPFKTVDELIPYLHALHNMHLIRSYLYYF